MWRMVFKIQLGYISMAELDVDVAVLKNEMINLKGELSHHYKDQETDTRKLHYEINKLEERITARIDRLQNMLEKRNGNGNGRREVMKRADTRYAAAGLGGAGGLYVVMEVILKAIP